MKGIKKVMSVLLILSMVFSATACGNKNKDAEDTAGTSAAVPADTDASTEEVKDLGTVTVINMGNEPGFDLEEDYYPMLDALTAKWGIKIRIQYVAWGEETTTLQTKIAGGAYDAVSVGAWSNYLTLAQNGSFKDLSPFLDEVPDLCETYGGKEQLLKVSVEGRGLCYIPQQADDSNQASANGVFYRKDLCDDLGVGEITDMESLDAYLYAAKAEYNRAMMYTPNVAGTLLSMFGNFTNDATGNISYNAVLSTSDDPYTAIAAYKTDAYKQALKKAVQWYNDGITDPDVLNSNAMPDVG